MYDSGKSDRPIVPEKEPNNTVSRSTASAGKSPWSQSAEALEGRGRTKGNTEQGNRLRTQRRELLQQALERVRRAAVSDRTARFTSLWHLVYDPERLQSAYLAIDPQSAAGIDGQTKQAYGEQLFDNLLNLSDRLGRGAYHAKAVKRVYIPKSDGRQRPIGVPALEDKIVQRSAAEVLGAIYEADFHDFSFCQACPRGWAFPWATTGVRASEPSRGRARCAAPNAPYGYPQDVGLLAASRASECSASR